MSYSTKDPDATPWWARRRVFGTALALTALVGSGAAAQASSHGDGFLLGMGGGGTRTMTAAPASRVNGMTQGGQAMNGGSAGNGMRRNGMRRDGMQGGWSWGATGWTWNGNTWTWNGNTWARYGGGVNRFAFRTIVDPADPTFTQLLGITDRGGIVGYFGSGADAAHPNKGFRVSAPYLRNNFVDENYPRSLQTQVVATNGRGIQVGFYVDGMGANHGFVRQSGRYQTVDFPGTTSQPMFNQLLGVNRHGIAAGFWNDAMGHSHGYLYNVRTGQFLLVRLPIRATSVVATGINDRNQVVGFYQIGKVTNGFVWSHGQFQLLRYGNHTNTQALGINDLGQVVGSFVDAHGMTDGFVRLSTHLVRIVVAPGSTSTVINGLNNRGQLVGFYTDKAKNTLGLLAHR